jgi:hypothetical protein
MHVQSRVQRMDTLIEGEINFITEMDQQGRIA